MAYYRRIKELREDHDKTQRDLAAVLGMPQSQYWRYEQGYRDIPTDILIRLAVFCKTEMQKIAERSCRLLQLQNVGSCRRSIADR